MGHVAVLCVVKVAVTLWVNVRGCDNSQHMRGGEGGELRKLDTAACVSSSYPDFTAEDWKRQSC